MNAYVSKLPPCEQGKLFFKQGECALLLVQLLINFLISWFEKHDFYFPFFQQQRSVACGMVHGGTLSITQLCQAEVCPSDADRQK